MSSFRLEVKVFETWITKVINVDLSSNRRTSSILVGPNLIPVDIPNIFWYMNPNSWWIPWSFKKLLLQYKRGLEAI